MTRRGTRGDHTPGRGRRRGPGSQGDLVARLKAHHGVRLRAQGWTYDSIARACWECILEATVVWPIPHPPEAPHEYQELYGDRSGAHKAVTRALEEEYGRSAATREELRREDINSLGVLLRATMPLAAGGDMEAARVAIKALERRAKLYGLDAPTRVAVTTEMDMQIAELIAQLGEEERLSQEAAG